ncbi:MAG: substrate-binding domain-containing protein [Pseudomonadota bacterium]
MTTDTPETPVRIRNISELAKLAGVSAGTVSRALAGKELVNRQTRDRIQALAREYGFHPNQMASRLRTGHTGVIGVVLPPKGHQKQNISDPFFMALLGHLADELTERGYDLMLSRVNQDHGDDWLDRIVDSGMLDGVLMIGQSNLFETIERVAAAYRPLVVWGAWREGQTHCVVGTDSIAGGRLAAQLLIRRGRRRLAFFGDTQEPEIAQRLEGVRSAISDSGAASLATITPFQTGLSLEGMSDQIAADFDRMDIATDGIIAASDTIAMAVLRLLHERGYRVPDDIALIGFDDLPIATQTVPQLTTIRQDIAKGARAMVETLMHRIAGTVTSSTVMPPRLIIRESV